MVKKEEQNDSERLPSNNENYSLTIFHFNLHNYEYSVYKQLTFFRNTNSPENYSAGNIVTRMLDGLGYRFYWASDSLSERDLAYRPAESDKTCEETILHIYNLSVTI